MTQVAEKIAQVGNYRQLASAIGNGIPWLQKIRQAAMDRFEAVGFPSTKEEEWRFTNVTGIARVPFVLGQATGSDLAARVLKNVSFGDAAAVELVFVNGHFEPRLSKLARLPKGVYAGTLHEAVKDNATVVEEYLTRYAVGENNPFVELNTAFLHEGAFVHVARGVEMKKPIHLVFLSVPGEKPTLAHPRVLIVAEDAAQAAIVESYFGAGEGVYLTNAVTEVVVGKDSRLDHCKLQHESLDAFHVAAMQVELKENAKFVSHSATLGAKLTRNDLRVRLNGEYADATLNGLVIINGDQHCDNHTLLHHEKAHCPSHELYKHVLSDRASGVFKGQIFVQRDAQKTDSKQTSKSLLLSDDAQMNSMPALEIYADDVKCTHGSTTGPVDEEMVFYLRSRGVGLEAARHLLTYAFAADITRRIKVEPVRRYLEDYMAAQHGLPQDLRITDLGAHDEAAL